MDRRQLRRRWFWAVSGLIMLIMVGFMEMVYQADRNLEKSRWRVVTTQGYFGEAYQSCVKKQAIIWPYLVPYTYYESCETIEIDQKS